MIDLLDVQVGEIMDKVEELGLASNTIKSFLQSDNGPHGRRVGRIQILIANGPLKGV